MNSLWLVIGMAVVTYLPRMLPMVYMKNMKLYPKLKRFLEFVPYTILASLIFPGILSSTANVIPAVAGGAAAILFATKGWNLISVVLGAILSVYATEQIILLLA
ncbi:AzlD domain-containing protein [Paenibacillus dakarensis]|uniref:AzlD domain-containing protein n=1 Tax=Paenibacillus dakarensis TaxID=1527293 RepID=UPI0009EC95E6|nr:AzlD domain-containing protein [Paenibacillus dakarensis]